MTIQLKTGDIFRFSYNENARKRFYDAYHCFEGLLTVRSCGKLEDSFWGSGGNRWFTLEEAQKQGELEFVCNLNDIEEIRAHEQEYYSDSDIFTITKQHGHIKTFYKRKGAKKSLDKMKKVVIAKIEKANKEVEYQMNQVTRYQESLLKLEMGETEGIYI